MKSLVTDSFLARVSGTKQHGEEVSQAELLSNGFVILKSLSGQRVCSSSSEWFTRGEMNVVMYNGLQTRLV